MSRISFIFLTVIIVIAVLIIIAYQWVLSQNPYHVLEWWNGVIDDECTIQDSACIGGVPGYYPIESFHQSDTVAMHAEIQASHDDILRESIAYMKSSGGCPMVEMDSVQSTFEGQTGWRPLWVKFLDGWAPGSDNLPTLKSIAMRYPRLTLLHVSVMHPGTILKFHRGPSRAVYRYHYGLSIPEGNLGLGIRKFYKIGTSEQTASPIYILRWVERNAFVWDDTIHHTSWNKSDKPRMIIFADIKRDLGPLYNLGTDIVYSVVAKSRQVSAAREVIQKYSTDRNGNPFDISDHNAMFSN